MIILPPTRASKFLIGDRIAWSRIYRRPLSSATFRERDEQDHFFGDDLDGAQDGEAVRAVDALDFLEAAAENPHGDGLVTRPLHAHIAANQRSVTKRI